ncbi:MAG: Gfo/Idh/MocA family oxidoreductase [Alphaproteobacteria bacterium]|jgi:predicted dehydrogenase|nr:Gfo/Idh/MocA family oxidoreductase [Alphaproteobacteria bacterium]
MEPVRWGVIGTAAIAIRRVIPATQASAEAEVRAIASRDLAKAETAAHDLGIPRAYGSYEELFADPEIEAVYNPLPNHLHIDWSIKAMEAGKHVLCEKPLALTAAEAARLIEARERTGRQVEEAFMCRNHPQWQKVRELIAEGRIGRVRAVQASFTYVNADPDDIRNQVESGGGGIYDIGSYCITMSRYVFDAEPRRVVALVERDPGFGTDRLTSALLDFEDGQASFLCGTQVTRHQHLFIFGTEGWMRLEAPFVQPPTHACRIAVGSGLYPGHAADETIELDPVNHYTLQSERFGRLVRGLEAESWPIETGVANMAVIDALFRSAESGGWETV